MKRFWGLFAVLCVGLVVVVVAYATEATEVNPINVIVGSTDQFVATNDMLVAGVNSVTVADQAVAIAPDDNVIAGFVADNFNSAANAKAPPLYVQGSTIARTGARNFGGEPAAGVKNGATQLSS